MNYIFVFLGEFGYELLNWQGVIRKFATTIDKTKDKIIVCSRAGLEPFYEGATKYIDISHLPYFKNSVANMYWAHNPTCNYYKHYKESVEGNLPWELMSVKDRLYQWHMKREIKQFVFKQLKISWLNQLCCRKYKFIFSSNHKFLHGLEFGSPNMNKSGIYTDLNLNNNLFTKITPPAGIEKIIEKTLGFSLTEPYILCQTAARSVVRRSKESISLDLLKILSSKIKVVLLDFDTQRNLDSKSSFQQMATCFKYTCHSFKEQSTLIKHAKCCLFFTEGDFRSHNYLPPFMGKNVYSVAPKTVFQLGTSPLAFWNENVFKFGGQIIPCYAEDVYANTESFIEKIINSEN